MDHFWFSIYKTWRYFAECNSNSKETKQQTLTKTNAVIANLPITIPYLAWSFTMESHLLPVFI